MKKFSLGSDFSATGFILAGFFAFSSLSTFSNASYALNIDEAVHQAIKHGLDSNIEEQKLIKSQMAQKKSISPLMPKFSASLGNSQHFANKGDDKSNTSFSLSLNQSISPSSIIGARQAKITYSEAELSYTLNMRKVVINAIKTYMDTLHNSEILKISYKNNEILLENKKETMARYSAGDLTIADVAQSDAALKLSDSQVINAEGNMEASKASYSRVFGTEFDENTVLEIPQKYFENHELPVSMTEVNAKLMENNLDLLIARIKVLIAEKGLEKARAAFGPTLSASLSTSSSGTAGSLNSNGSNFAINANLPIFQGGAEYYELKSAKAELRKINLEMEKTSRRVRETAIKNFSDLKLSFLKVEAAEKQVESAKIALESVYQERSVGNKNTIDVLRAEETLFKAQSEIIDAVRDSILAIYNLKFVMGESIYGI